MRVTVSHRLTASSPKELQTVSCSALQLVHFCCSLGCSGSELDVRKRAASSELRPRAVRLFRSGISPRDYGAGPKYQPLRALPSGACCWETWRMTVAASNKPRPGLVGLRGSRVAAAWRWTRSSEKQKQRTCFCAAHPRSWLSSSFLASSLSPSADTLSPPINNTLHSTQLPPSESSFQEPLNYSPASSSSSSFHSTTTTFDFTSFTTASQQSTWLPSPAPSALRQPRPLSHPDFALPQTDFVLYDQLPQVSPRPQRAPSAPQTGHTFNAGQQFYANSAPSSTTGFQQPQSIQQQQRPPVPLFSSSSANIFQSNAAVMADLHSNNSFDSNMGAGLGPAFGSDFSLDMSSSAFTAVNDHSVASGSTRTVSPKDIFQDPLGSAPPSTAFTNLTSPDIGESPFITDSYETSPMFQGDAMMASDTWFSLFPEDADMKSTAPVAPDLERTVSSNSMARSSSSSTNSPIVLDSSHRRKSSVNGSPATNAAITKARRRKGPLPPIAVDPGDKVALKRARNTLAARDSRQRKFDYVSTLEKRNADLEAELEKWKNIAISQGYNGL
ncbi:hypothetical protein P154DRAFT_622939 [Amniculicola lignicola CBS 123094]|uniref:BZIP domain-containing protein n=1 Tax=Amniculicola lignicola CBS 123094 TaxID=1392246 RepID=A0A6A5W4U9_9PLEO|nr:hypothetical protein P154DRAFT_622939 [Amniculicola lignicola CBS 123094]